MTTSELIQLHRHTSAKCFEKLCAAFIRAEGVGDQEVLGMLSRMSEEMQRLAGLVSSGDLSGNPEGFEDGCEALLNHAVHIKFVLREVTAAGGDMSIEQLHRDTCARCLDIMQRKNADYCGGSGDPFANFRISAMVGVPPALGILMRITDKMQRIRAFVTTGSLAVKSESFEDACDDIVNYTILLKGLLLESVSRGLGM